MTSNDYDLVVYTPNGSYVARLTDYNSFRVSYGERRVGIATILTGHRTRRAINYPWGTRLEIWRTVGTTTYLEGGRLWYLLGQRDYRTETGARMQLLTFFDANYLLDKRSILAPAGDAQAQMTDCADDMIKTIIRQTLGTSATDTARTVAGLTVEADRSACGSISKAFHGRKVLDVINEICGSSLDDGLYLTYDFVRSGVNSITFRTYTGQRGVNRGINSGSPIILRWEAGNLAEPSLAVDYYDGYNYIYAAGQGQGGERLTAYKTYSVPQVGERRLETYIDARNVDSQDELQEEADAAFQQLRPRFKFNGYLADTQSLRYGLQLGYGDIVGVAYENTELDVHITNVEIDVDDAGNESKRIVLQNYD